MKIVSSNVWGLQPATIEFTPAELQFLHDLLGAVGGHPYETRRRIGSDIRAGLATLPGITNHTYGAPDQTGSIYYSEPRS